MGEIAEGRRGGIADSVVLVDYRPASCSFRDIVEFYKID